MKQKDMYIDQVMRKVENGLTNAKNEERTTITPRELPIVATPTGNIVLTPSLNTALAQARKDLIVDQAKTILIEDRVAQCMYGIPFSQTDHESEFRMPYPVIFFEFMKPLYIQTMEEKDMPLAALLFYKTEIEERLITHPSFAKLQDEAMHDEYSINFFYNNRSPIDNDIVRFRLSKLPSFKFIAKGNHYHYDSVNNQLRLEGSGVWSFNSSQSRLRDIINNGYALIDDEEEQGQVQNSYKVIDLIINLIDLINAQNITIKPVERGKRKVTKRIDGKKQRIKVDLKPYYILDIKKVDYREREKEQREGWTLDYRLVVMGHFWRYPGHEKIWVDPYVRGPEDTPFKNNRHRVLYEKVIAPYENQNKMVRA